MSLQAALACRVTQQDFADAVGVTQPRVAQLIGDGILPADAVAAQWLLAYCERLREQAAGRGQELTVERAALARSQRIGQDLKNAVAQGEYAPIGLLADVLAAAAAAVVDRLDQLPGQLRKACPDLPAEARDAVMRTIASARNEWIRSTEELVVRRIADLTEPLYDDDPTLAGVPIEEEHFRPAA